MVRRNDTVIKILYFDTSAIIKYFVREKGSDLIKWIVNNRVLYSLSLETSQIGLYEFKKSLKKKAKRGDISNDQMKKIISKSKDYFFQKSFISKIISRFLVSEAVKIQTILNCVKSMVLRLRK